MKSSRLFPILLCCAASAAANDGAIDFGFGDFIGRSVIATNDPQSANHYDSAVQPFHLANNKLYLLGHSPLNDQRRNTMFRLNVDGTADTTFNGGSSYRQLFLAGVNLQPFLVEAVAQEDGKIVSVGNTQRSVGNANDRHDIALCRYAAAGNFDPGFGAGGLGCVLIDINGGLDSEEYADAVAIDHFGRILVLGHTDGFEHFVARFTPQGAYDIEFNGGIGLRMLDLPELDQQLFEAIDVDHDGRIVIAGYGNFPDDERYRAVVMRLDDGGGFDPDFSGDGRVAFTLSVANDPLPRSASINDLAIDHTGRIALVGRTALPDLDHPDARAAFIRLQANGTLDPTFNGSGYRLDRGPEDAASEANQVHIDDAGRWVAGGSSRVLLVGATTNTMVWRLTDSGLLDSRFDGDGRVYLDNAITYGSNDCSDDFIGIALEHDSILVSMTSQAESMANDTDIITMRLVATDLFADGFE